MTPGATARRGITLFGRLAQIALVLVALLLTASLFSGVNAFTGLFLVGFVLVLLGFVGVVELLVRVIAGGGGDE